MKRQKLDILVVGGGAVGLATACGLAGRGRRIGLVEAREPEAFDADDYDLRVFAISPASDRILAGVGAWEAIRSRRVSPYRQMEVRDAAGSGHVRFDAADVGEPYLGHIVENRLIRRALYDRLASLPGVELFCPDGPVDMDLVDEGALVRLESGTEVEASLVVGADGARSQIRRLAGIEVDRRDHEQRGVVAHVATEKPHGETARQRFLPDGPLAFLPLADGRCSIVWSTTGDHAKHLADIPDEQFTSELTEAFDGAPGRVTSTTKRVSFPLQSMHARQYVAPGLVLVGDAAHSVHPLAGQGVNLGLLDAAALIQVLEDAGDDADPGEYRVLRRYERWRRGDNLLMLKSFDGFRDLFATSQPAVTLARNLGMQLFDRVGPVKNRVILQAMGYRGEVPRLAR